MEVDDDAFSQDPSAHPELWQVLAAAALPSLRLTHAGACEPASTTTRLGGVPLLAAGSPWPHTVAGQPLSLVGQWNTNELNAWLGESRMPADLILSFFYDAVEQRAWGYDPADAQFWRVLPAKAGEAEPVPAPPGAETFAGIGLRGQRVLTVPDMWDRAVLEFSERDRQAVKSVYRRLDSRGNSPCHRAFGWPEPVQNPMQLECQLASNGIYVGGPEGYRDPRAAALSAGASEWQLLWQIDTDEDAGWMWGDTGTIYYWIRREDLMAGVFDRIWMIFQCC